MEKLFHSEHCDLYGLPQFGRIRRLILSTPETRRICNSPLIYGVEYTTALEIAMTKLFTAMKESGNKVGSEDDTLVINILRGGLNFGLRNALASAYGWNKHRCAFISSQRVYDQKEGWHITENRYQKVPTMPVMDLVFADVVATGVSLEHAVLKFINLAKEQNGIIRQMTFITIGGQRTEEIMAKASALCIELFENYEGTCVIYIEGIFGVADENSKLSIAIPGTDLLRSPALLSPEFIESEKEDLSYAIERCAIYDAGSRAFDTREYIHDVKEYWGKVLSLAESGTTYIDYLEERFPQDARLQNKEFVNKYSSSSALKKVAEDIINQLNA